MPEILDHVAYLSQEIGPRPAGTEEEQQAALYITEQMQKEAGLSAVIEDFNGAPDADIPRIICCACSLVVAILALFLPIMGVASIVVTLLAALLFAAEAFDRPVLSKLLARGVSQNVVAKYEPGYSAEAGGSRRRKVIVVARYDSGKVRAELNSPLITILPGMQWASLGAMILLPVLLVFRNVIFLNAEGVLAIVLNTLVVIAAVLVAIPLLFALLHKLAAYNEGANCNAAGTAVLMEVATRVGRGRVSEVELAAREEAAIHGEQAARAAGLVPEGAEIVYESEGLKPPEPAPQTPEARLVAAKAAIAALSGKPVSGISASDIAQNLVQVKDQPLPSPTDDDFRELRDETREAFATIPPETMQEALANAEEAAMVSPEEEEAAAARAAELAAAAAMGGLAAGSASAVARANTSDGSDEDVPDWFKKAQEKAKKPRSSNKPVQRSRYASALDAAVSESAGHFAEAATVAEQRAKETPAIAPEDSHEVKAPQWSSAPQGHEEQDTPTVVEAEAVPVYPESSQFEAPVATPEMERTEAPATQPQASEADPYSTTAMPPIDVSAMRLGEIPTLDEPSIPSFLNPRKVQEEVRASLPGEPRTDNRVDVTDVRIDGSGRIEYVPSPVEASPVDEPTSDQGHARRPIVLPDIGASAPKPVPISDLQKQRAPLADVETAGKSAAKSLLTMLPSISVGEVEGTNDATGTTDDTPVVSGTAKNSLRSMLPSLSGAISRGEVTDAKTSVNTAGSFVPAGATGTFAPIGDELLDNIDPEDIYVDDADDSAYDENFTETGAFAGPGYVEMPKSRVHRLFDRFRRKGKEEEASPQEWLEVDESFDAREVGAQRGGWESFRAEDDLQNASATTRIDNVEYDYDDEFDEYEDDGYEDEPAGNPNGRFASPDFDLNDVDDFDEFSGGERRPWHGGAFSSRRRETLAGDSEELALEEAAGEFASEVPSELKQIYQFRNPDINTEVWFVALGSELSQNGGMRAFLAEHQQDLRGSIIIDLDALGAGDLCMIEREGMYRAAKTSSRMKRYVKKASQATGLSVGGAQMMWEDSAASFAIKHGYQAMHLVGMDGAKPAFFAQGDDVMENIDEETLTSNANFVMELLKNI